MVGGEEGGGQKKAARKLRHMTMLYKSTSCHQQQRAPEWEGGERGSGISSPGFSGKSLCSKTDPDLITDRQLYWALGWAPSDLSHGHTDHC